MPRRWYHDQGMMMASVADSVSLTLFPFIVSVVMTALQFLRVSLLSFVTACVAVGCIGCGRSTAPSGDGGANSGSGGSRAAVAVQLNWFPESEHGGVYQAKSDGTYDKAELNVEIRPGGRATPIGPELELERCQFAFANADDVVLFRQQGMDVVAVLAALQDHPRCILVRADSGVNEFKDLVGKTFQRQNGRAYVEFMRSKGLLEGVNEVPYHGSVASLIADPNIVVQAYSFAEPLLAQQQGVDVRTLMVSDLGFNPYSSVLVTTGKLIREQPELVRSFVTATRQGWQNYLESPERGNEAILAANDHGMTAEALAFGAEQMKPLAMPNGMSPTEVGQMSAQRWQTLVNQMAELGLVDPKTVTPESCFTNEFLSGE
ncbi:ABC transporter substrate-binding protein [Stieleria varia]|uniref:NMT1/THI5 like protein n=1 Tax=Stieleria varia TaxID=2528005 RepID=A0A5C6B7V8_9BACT|nr:ABC transporter substrate-binding protein [Stieleria varia]TWU07692.1 NMT1/THI5 like protein [Stieleria varia]